MIQLYKLKMNFAFYIFKVKNLCIIKKKLPKLWTKYNN